MFLDFSFKLRIVFFTCLTMLLIYPLGPTLPTGKSPILGDVDSQLEQSPLIKNIDRIEKVVRTASTTEDILVSFGTDDKYSPATAVDTDRNLWTVYIYHNTTHYLLDILKSADNGENWTREAYIFHDYWIDNPDIAVDLYDNCVYVVYEYAESGNTSSGNIGISRFNQSSSTLNVLGVDTDTNDQRNPSIAIEATYGSDNHIYVAYEQVVSHNESKMIVQKSTTHGDTWIGWHTRGFSDQMVHTQMDIAVDFSGQVYLTYAYGENYSALLLIIVEFGPRDSTSSSFEFAGWVFSVTLPVTVNFPVIAVSRSTAITTRIAIAFEYIWGPLQGGDADIIVSSSSDGGVTWSDSYITSSMNPEQRPNIVTDRMNANSSTDTDGSFYLVYTKRYLGINDTFIILSASYSSLSTWTEIHTYQGIKNIWNTTKRVFGLSSYSNSSTSNFILTYGATSCYGCSDTQIYATIISSDVTTIGNASFTFASPTNITKWTAGTIETIRWTSTGTINFVNIFLYKGNTTLGWIAQGAANVGYYDWGIPDFLDPGTDYWMDIEDADNTAVYAFSSLFEIVVDNPRIYFTNPTPVSSWRTGATYVITWNCKNQLGEVTLELLKDGDVEDVLSDDTDGESHFKWEIPDDVSEGDDYQLKISLNSNPNIFGLSEEFNIIAPFFQKEKSTETAEAAFLPIPGFDFTIITFGIIAIISYKRKYSRKSEVNSC